MPVFVSSVKIAFFCAFMWVSMGQETVFAQHFVAESEALQGEIRVWLGKIFSANFSDDQAAADSSEFVAFLLDQDESFDQIMTSVHSEAEAIWRESSDTSEGFFELREAVFNTALLDQVDRFNSSSEHAYQMTSLFVGGGVTLGVLAISTFIWFKRKTKKPISRPSILKYSAIGLSCGLALGILGANVIVKEPAPIEARVLEVAQDHIGETKP